MLRYHLGAVGVRALIRLQGGDSDKTNLTGFLLTLGDAGRLGAPKSGPDFEAQTQSSVKESRCYPLVPVCILDSTPASFCFVAGAWTRPSAPIWWALFCPHCLLPPPLSGPCCPHCPCWPCLHWLSRPSFPACCSTPEVGWGGGRGSPMMGRCRQLRG